MEELRRKPVGLIALTYTLLSAAWVLFSDQVIPPQLHSIKGVLFVFASGFLFYLILRWGARRLSRLEREIRGLVETIPLAVVGMDPEGRVAEWNPEAARLYGWTAQEAVGGHHPAVPPEQAPVFQERLQAALAGNTHAGISLERRKKDGSPVGVSLYMTPFLPHQEGGVSFYEVAADVTEQRRAAAILSRYQMLVENTMEVVLFIRRSDGRILDANRAAERAYGYSREELLGLTLSDLRAEGAPIFVEANLARAGSPDGAVRETLHRRSDGRLFPVELSMVGLELEGEPVLMSLIRDVSRARQRELSNRLLMEVDHRILQQQSLESVLSFLCEGVAAVYGSDLVWIGLKEDSGRIRVGAVTGRAAHLVQGDALRWDLPAERTYPSARAIQTGRVQTGPREGDPVGEELYQTGLAAGVRSYLCIPLVVRESVIGVLTMMDSHAEAFEAERVEHLQIFASQVALSILTAESQASIRLQTAALEAAAHAIVIVDREGLIQWANPAFTQMTGFEIREVRGQKTSILKSGRHHDGFYAHLWHTVLAGKVWRGEMQNCRRDGSIYTEEMTITPVRDLSGWITHFIAIKLDVTERKRLEDQARYLSRNDALTGLPNRQAFEEILAVAVQRAKDGRSATLLIADVDGFQAINEIHGHPTGDRLLANLAHRLRLLMRPGDLIARLGSDEFGILADGISGDDANALVEAVRREVAASGLMAGDELIQPTVSIGLVSVDGQMETGSLLTLLDGALEAAREQGGSQAVFWTGREATGLDHAESARLGLYLKQSIRAGRFVLHFQPVVHLATGQLSHYEALLRLWGPAGELLPPSVFLPAAERYRLMPQIDAWVLGRALKELQARPKLCCFVNISGQTLQDDETLTHLEQLVREAGHGVASRLTLEVTETAAVGDLLRAALWMSRFIVLGCHFALDDFGTGFSSFGYLRVLPVSYIKIDGSFVRNLQEDQTSKALVQAIAGVAHTLGKVVVAEWVENPEIAAALREMGVEYGQGYGLGRPSPHLPA